ncbi:MAG: hypothetical protein FGM32_02445 [Candidatus Kapabacteria bacterium]|nr:hypothetical protein [Candidatus Kapabacteria bacterium]
MMTALNVVIRSAVIVLGAMMVMGVLSAFPAESPLNQTFGVIVVLFGIYRMVHYVSLRRREERDDDDHANNT